jgi:HD-like signal output (HDOD) protein/CheY-like chemotaxis protein
VTAPAPFPTRYSSSSALFDVLSLEPQTAGARVLLVDDDPIVLTALKRVLSDSAAAITAVSSAEAALAELGRGSFDIVMADLSLDSVSGATLLGAVQKQHPDVVRIVMSAGADPDTVLRTVPFAHQFLTKGVDAELLRVTLRRASGLRALLTNETLRSVLGASNDLPAAPDTYLKLTNLLRDPETGLAEVAEVVERDVGISARVLQLVSSAFFGAPRRAKTLLEAVSYLGVETLRTLVLSLEIVRMFRGGATLRAFSVDKLQKHAFTTAKLARGLAGERRGDDAFVAGMLHSMGQLVLAERLSARYLDVIERATAEKRPVFELEREVLGATNTDAAGYLLGLWGLPQRVVEAVIHHREPWKADPARLGIVGAVYVASTLASNSEAPLRAETEKLVEGDLSKPYLEKVGVLESLPVYRALARRAAL